MVGVVDEVAVVEASRQGLALRWASGCYLTCTATNSINNYDNCLNLCQIVNLRFQMWYENLIGLSMIIEDSEKGLSNEVFHLSMDHLIADDETGV